MSMHWGMANRLARIIKADGRAVMLAVDHGYFLGPTSGLEEPRKTIEPLMPYADSIMLTRGVLRTSVDASGDTELCSRSAFAGLFNHVHDLNGHNSSSVIGDAKL